MSSLFFFFFLYKQLNRNVKRPMNLMSNSTAEQLVIEERNFHCWQYQITKSTNVSGIISTTLIGLNWTEAVKEKRRKWWLLLVNEWVRRTTHSHIDIDNLIIILAGRCVYERVLTKLTTKKLWLMMMLGWPPQWQWP